MGKKFDELKDCLRDIEHLRYELMEAIEAGAHIERVWDNTGLVPNPKSVIYDIEPEYYNNGSQVFTFKIYPYK